MNVAELTGHVEILARIESGLSPRQREALELRGSGLLSAGAGAGKTTTMVGVITRDLLVDGVDPRRILVCTFTRAAAANLASRTASRVSELTEGRAPNMAGMWIGTIDALCARLLREHALDANLPPRFQIGDERALWPLKLQALELVFREAESEDLHLLGEVIDPTGQQFAAELDRLYDRVRAGEHDPSALSIPVPPAAGEGREVLIGKLAELMPYVATNHGTKLEMIVEALNEERVEAIPEELKLGRPLKGAPDDAVILIEDAAESLAAYRLGMIDRLTHGYREAVRKILAAYAHHYSRLKREAELLDFTDLTLHARRLIADVATGAAGRFDRVYVDEAQDTNPLQLGILKGMLSPGGVIMAVGDASQSIYGFRHADVEAFRQQRREVHGNVVTLDENYRSQPRLLHTINAICARIPELAQDLIVMEPKAEEIPAQNGSAVELLTLTAEENVSCFQEAASAVPGILAARDRIGLRNADITVLCEANADASVYADALRAAGVPTLLIQKKGLMQRDECLDVLAYLHLLAAPDDEEALLRVLSSPFAGLPDLRLHQIATIRSDRQAQKRVQTGDPEAIVPLWSVLHSDESAFCERFEQLRAQVRDRRVAELARMAVEAHGFDLALALADPTGAMWRNVEKLIGVISGLEREHSGPSLPAIVERLEAEREAGIDEGQDARLPAGLDAVRVMTIHNAKGDEFPLTVVGRLSKSSRAQGVQILWATVNGKIGISLGAGLHDSAAAAERDRQNKVREEEKRRLLYVAMTRAQRHLVMVASAKLKKDGSPAWSSFARWLIADGLEGAGAPAGGEERLLVLHGAHVPGEVLLRGLTAADPVSQGAAKITTLQGSVVADSDQAGEPYLLADGPLSYAALTRWRRCGLRRHLERDLGLQPQAIVPLRLAADDETAPPSLAPALAEIFGEVAAAPAELVLVSGRNFGLRVHNFLAEVDWHDRVDLDRLGVHGLDGPEGERARELIARIEASPLRERLRVARRVRTEVPFSFALGGHVIQGFIDVLAEEARGVLIVDWKSGEDTEDLFTDDYALQRRLYGLAALEAGQEPVEVVTFHAASGDSEIETFTIAETPVLELEVEAAVGEILTLPALPAATVQQPFCHGCPGLVRGCPVAHAAP